MDVFDIVDNVHRAYEFKKDNKPRYVILHTTNSSVEDSQYVHKHIISLCTRAIMPSNDRYINVHGYKGIASYPCHDLIDHSGCVWHLNNYDANVQHTVGYNNRSISLGIIIDTIANVPRRIVLDTISFLCYMYCISFDIKPSNIYGHNQLKPKQETVRDSGHPQYLCAGIDFYLDDIRKDVIDLLCKNNTLVNKDNLLLTYASLRKFYNTADKKNE